VGVIAYFSFRVTFAFKLRFR